MSVEGEICALIRGAKNIQKAIPIAATVYCLTKADIKRILQENGLMTADGVYVPPIRLTGREYLMGNWRWSKERKQKVQQLLDNGKTPEQIAQVLGCEVSAVVEYVGRLPSKVTTSIVQPPGPANNSEEDTQPPEGDMSITLYASQLWDKATFMLDQSIELAAQAACHVREQVNPQRGLYELGMLHIRLNQIAELLAILENGEVQ